MSICVYQTHFEAVYRGSWYGTRGELGPPLGSHRLRAVEVNTLLAQMYCFLHGSRRWLQEQWPSPQY